MKMPRTQEDFAELKRLINSGHFVRNEITISGNFIETDEEASDIIFEGFPEDKEYIFMDFECQSLTIKQNSVGIQLRSNVVIRSNKLLLENVKMDKFEIALSELSSTQLEIKIAGSRINHLNVEGSLLFQSLILNSSSVDSILVVKTEIINLLLTGSTSSKSRVRKAVIDLKGIKHFKSSSNTFFDELSLANALPYEVNLDGAVIEHLFLESFKKGVRLVLPNKLNVVEIKGFNFEESQSQSVQPLFNAKKVIIHSAIGLKKIQGSIEWPKVLEGLPEENQIVFKEIKEMALEESKYDSASYYKRMELLSHYRHQKSIQGTWYNKLELDLTMGLPFFASRFGTKLLRPIVILLASHVILSAIMILTSGTYYGLEFTGYISSSSFIKSCELYFYTILPTHSLNYAGGSLNPIVSFFMRLVSGIFIYHIVLTSRTHLK